MLNEIQQKLKAPKGQMHKFGKYKYRSCEDILEAVKPLLGDAALILSDEIVEIGGNIYVKATAKIIGMDKGHMYETTAFAREPKEKKGMDPSQITGAASSYARKYALNGLFCIDDTKDADTMDNTSGDKTAVQTSNPKTETDPGTYILKFGKFQGMPLNSLDNEALKSWRDWLNKGHPATGKAKEATIAVDIYFADKA